MNCREWAKRLGLGERTVVSHGVPYDCTEVNRAYPRRLSPRHGLGGSGSWTWSQSPFWTASSSFYTSFFPSLHVHMQVQLYRVGTCPISPYPKWLDVVVKAEKHGSVRCRVLDYSNGSLSFVLCRFNTFPVRRNDSECHHQDQVAPFALGYIYGRGGSFPWPRRILPMAKGWAFLGSGLGPSTDIDMRFPILYPPPQ